LRFRGFARPTVGKKKGAPNEKAAMGPERTIIILMKIQRGQGGVEQRPFAERKKTGFKNRLRWVGREHAKDFERSENGLEKKTEVIVGASENGSRKERKEVPPDLVGKDERGESWG